MEGGKENRRNERWQERVKGVYNILIIACCVGLVSECQLPKCQFPKN